MSEQEQREVGVIKPKVFANASSSSGNPLGSTLTKEEIRSLRGTRKKEALEVTLNGLLIRIILCGHLQAAEDTPEVNLFQKLQSVKSVGEYESKSASSPSGKVKSLLAAYYYNSSLTFEGGENDLAGAEQNDYLRQLQDNGQLRVPPSFYERDGLLDDDAPAMGVEDTREFVIENGRVMVSKATSLSLAWPEAQVWLSLTYSILL